MARQLTLAQTFHPTKTPEPTRTPSKAVWQLWGKRQSVLIGQFGNLKVEGRISRGILALDLDGTLIVPKSGRKWPKDVKDWCWLYGGPKGTLIKDKIHTSYEEGYEICVLSNQKYTAANKTPELHVAALKEKLEDVFATISTPLRIFCALADDEYRKPRTGLLQLMDVNGSDNTYVGDAAGRPKDHSACDYQWALNANWKFMTPEMFFLKRQSDLPTSFDLDPRQFKFCDKPSLADVLKSHIDDIQLPQFFILVGPPGSGKSFLARTALSHCKWLNQDVLKDRNKLLKQLQQFVKEGSSVVVDRMNASVVQRRPFIEVAQARKISVTCIHLQVSRAMAQHGNIYRTLSKTTKEHRGESVPTLAYNMYYKDLEEPTEEEGFHRIIRIKPGDFSFGPFESIADSELFFQFLR